MTPVKPSERWFETTPLGEPINPGPNISTFMQSIADMGDRAIKWGTIAGHVRERGQQKPSIDSNIKWE